MFHKRHHCGDRKVHKLFEESVIKLREKAPSLTKMQMIPDVGKMKQFYSWPSLSAKQN